MEQKITRKDFLLSLLSIAGLVMASKIPKMAQNSFSLLNKETNLNTYSNSSYGGTKKV